MSFLRTNNLALLLGASFIALSLMMMYIIFSHHAHMQHMREVMVKSQNAVLKVRYYSEMMEYARARTRLTSQILDTEDFFEKDELNQNLEIFASKFARTYQALNQLPLSAYEQKQLKSQQSIVSVILPAQRKVVSLSMHGTPSENAQARDLFYSVVIEGQNRLIDLFQGLIAYHQENTEDLLSSTDSSLLQALRNQNLYAIVILFIVSTISVFVVRRTHTIQKQLESERNSLEETVQNRTQELVQARDEAQQANRAKSEFLSSMSHELRTPLNAVLGFGQMLEFNRHEPLTDNQKECVHHIKKGGQHLLELINKVLDLVKIESGKIELSIEDISLDTVIDECMPLITTLAEKRDITVYPPHSDIELPKVRADYTRLKQVLLNLLSNAVKYNRTGGRVSLEVKPDNHDNLIISVSDTGEGISEANQKELFKPFNRLDATNSDIEGTGIGLVITKDLVEMMGGSIGFESEINKGSTFWFAIPLAVTSAETNTDHFDDELLVAKLALHHIDATLLYVEDNPDNLKLMELVLSHVEGMSMSSAHTGELGLEMARMERPDIIILDINLPGMNGIEVLKELQNDDATRNIPVLALSAAATKSDIEKGLTAGFKQYLTKPINVPEVVQAIQSELDARNSRQTF